MEWTNTGGTEITDFDIAYTAKFTESTIDKEGKG